MSVWNLIFKKSVLKKIISSPQIFNIILFSILLVTLLLDMAVLLSWFDNKVSQIHEFPDLMYPIAASSPNAAIGDEASEIVVTFNSNLMSSFSISTLTKCCFIPDWHKSLLNEAKLCRLVLFLLLQWMMWKKQRGFHL